MWAWSLARHLSAIVATVVVGAFLAATMVRMAPGFDVDEQQLDSRLSSQTIEAARSARAQNKNIGGFYVAYLRRVVHGDFGRSQTLSQPVRTLITERAPVSFRLMGIGLLAGWSAAILVAFCSAMVRSRSFGLMTLTLTGLLLCIPSAVVALALVIFRMPASLAISLVVFPKVFSVAHNLIARGYEMQHIITARAKGISEARVLFWHVLPVSGPQLIALAGVSVSFALGAAIPVEALCGIPGIGQLAWQAALGRDLPLLVTVTALVCVVTLVANSAADLVNVALEQRT
jgi:peptide/nickel transport system permease protein